MYRPTKIFDSLIYLNTILSSLWGPESIMLHFQSPQHPHSRFAKRIPLNHRHFQICNHPIEILFKKRMHTFKCFFCFRFYTYLLQFCQCFICFFFILAISKKTPDIQQKTSHLTLLSASMISIKSSFSSSYVLQT